MKPMLRNRSDRNRMRVAGLAACVLLFAGCASVRSHWPFARHAPAAPEAVAELEVGLPEQGTPPVVLQYWERNTLVVDLTSVAAQGHVTLRPGAGRGWPVRIAFRMPPRRFAELEVRGAQRLVVPVAAGGTVPVTAELPPGVYQQDTPELVVSWGAAGSF
jgi:hypothetical protein